MRLSRLQTLLHIGFQAALPCALALGALTLSLGGCVAVPFMQGISELGVTEGGRQRLFAKEIKRFNSARSWENPVTLIDFISPTADPKLLPQLQSDVKGRRVVDSKIDTLTFADNAYRADVGVTVRSFKTSSYLVEEQVEHQRWEYSSGAGWKIVARSSGSSLPPPA